MKESPKQTKALERALARPCQPTYDITKSYEWNYRFGPGFKGPFPPRTETGRPVRFLDFEVASRIGIAAGPLLNSKWIRLYSRLGFDILTYKTVRSAKRPSNPKPNCVLLDTGGLIGPDDLDRTLIAGKKDAVDMRDITITNSFGVPSRNPNIWQEDVQKAKRAILPRQVLIVSVMGSSEVYPDIAGFTKDFAVCASMARESGADIIELDLSCPNSNAAEGMVYRDAGLSSAISKAVKAEIGVTPLFIKMGFFSSREQFETVIAANAPHVEGIVGINTLRMTVLKASGEPALGGRPQSGVCGAAIKLCAKQFIGWLIETRKLNRYDFLAVGVGGVMTPADIDEFLESGIDAVETATAPMWDPYLAYRYRLSHGNAGAG
jgi:dihydroorotate dehydrogenase (NAD+) catalytic subunit